MTATAAANARTAAVVAAVNRWWWQATGAAIVLAWVGVALADRARMPPVAAAAAAGTALLAMAPPLAVAGAPGVAGVVALVGLPVAIADAARGGGAAPLGATLGALVLLAAFVEFRRSSGPSLSLVVLAVGVAAVVTGLAAGSFETDKLRVTVSDRPAAAVVLAGAALVLAAVGHRNGAERAVMAPVVLAALLAAPALPALAVVLGWGIFAAGAAFLERPAASLASLAVVAAAAGAAPAGLLFAAAAVLAAALDVPLAAMCGLPAAVVLAGALADRPRGGVVLAAAAALAGTSFFLALRMRLAQRVDGGRPLALALAAWLVVAPGTWAFSGATTLHAYDIGALRAIAAGALVVLALVFRRGAELAWPARTSGEERDGTDALIGPPIVGVAIATVATVASIGWLVVSVVRLH